MGQGTIAMPGYQQGQMTQVAAALQAVHDYYGIDTEKQRQSLLAAQTAHQKAETEHFQKLSPLQISAEEMKNAHLAKMNPLEEEKATLANEQTRAMNPVQLAEAKARTSSAQSSASTDAEMAKESRNYAAGKGMGPLLAMAHGAWGTTPSGGGQSPASGGGGGGGAPGLPSAPIVFGNGKTQQAVNYPLATAQADYAHKVNQESREASSQVAGFQDKFREDIKAPFTQIQTANQISKELTSGNNISAQVARKHAEMLSLGLSRMPQTDKLTEEKQTLAHVNEWLSQHTKGMATPEVINKLNELTNSVGQSAANEIDALADMHAGQNAQHLKMDPQAFKQNILLPGYKGFRPVQSMVRNIGGKSVLLVNREDK